MPMPKNAISSGPLRRSVARHALAAGLAVTVAAAAGIAWAQSDEAAAGRPAPRAERIFERLDADGDGRISRAEMERGRAAMHARLDADGDGSLSEAELRAPMEARLVRRAAKRFARLDANGDGRIDAAEFERPVERSFGRLDGDGDGAVSHDELRAAGTRRVRE